MILESLKAPLKRAYVNTTRVVCMFLKPTLLELTLKWITAKKSHIDEKTHWWTLLLPSRQNFDQTSELMPWVPKPKIYFVHSLQVSQAVFLQVHLSRSDWSEHSHYKGLDENHNVNHRIILRSESSSIIHMGNWLIQKVSNCPISLKLVDN